MTHLRSGRRGLRFWLSVVVALVFAAVVLGAAPRDAHAGSYLDRAALLLGGSKRDSDMLRGRLTDKELATVVQAIAETRVRAASHMEVPAAVGKAHPHLLMALQNAERAAAAAIVGDFKISLEKLEAARREHEAFRAICKELNFTLPAEGAPPPRSARR